jgi:aspartyl-tRNA(Asn)/glutamyl-tRNA(Gln) amidotransferase subunit C
MSNSPDPSAPANAPHGGAALFDEALVRKIAHLSRLEMTDEEVRMYAGQLSRILEYVEKLSEVNTDNVEPLTHALPVTNVLRPDEPRPSLSQEAALANAPARAYGHFKVPAVLDGEGA